jgi:hypothetical protein
MINLIWMMHSLFPDSRVARKIDVVYCTLYRRWSRHVELKGPWDSIYGLNKQWQRQARFR